MRPGGRIVAAVLFVAVIGAGVPVGADATSTTTSTTTTTAPTTTSTTSMPPQPTAPPAPEPSPEQVAGHDAVAEPPPAAVAVPPAPVPPPAPPAAPRQRVAALLDDAERRSAAVRRALAAARADVERRRAAHDAAAARLAQLTEEQRALTDELVAARDEVRRNAVSVYTGGGASRGFEVVLRGGDPSELTRRVGVVTQLLREQRRAVDRFDAAKQAAGRALADAVHDVAATRSDYTLAHLGLLSAEHDATTAGAVAANLAASREIVGRGFVFPVAGRTTYSSTFGAPRMFGTPFAHTHQGTDIFAASGTPLVACERGVITRVGTDRLGGIKLWIAGESGTRYYYAHLSGYADGMQEGQVVDPGTVVGYVGNTGNALSTPAHLHFEVHPGGGSAIDPFPILRAVDPAT